MAQRQDTWVVLELHLMTLERYQVACRLMYAPADMKMDAAAEPAGGDNNAVA